MQDVYDQSLSLHVTTLVLVLILSIVYIVAVAWPAHKRCIQEGRRVAELLSTLPPDIKVESLLQQALDLAPAAAQGSKSFKGD
jgi:hypothetical protein